MGAIYVPGWAESPGFQEGMGKLFNALPGMIDPNGVAAKKLQAAIQNNPGLINDIANMTEDQRNQFAAGFGYKNTAKPFANLGEGQKLKDQNEKNAAIAGLTPEQKSQRVSGLAGVSTQTDLDRETTKFTLGKKKDEIGIKNAEQQNELNSLELASKNRTEELQKLLRTRYPDLVDVDVKKEVDTFFTSGKNSVLAQRLSSDPVLGPLWDQAAKAREAEIERRSRYAMATLKTPQEKYMGLQFVQSAVDNAQNAVKEAQVALGQIGIADEAMDGGASKQAAIRNYQAAMANRDENTARFNELLKATFGDKYDVGNYTEANKLAQAILSGRNTVEDLARVPEPLRSAARKIVEMAGPKKNAAPKPAVNNPLSQQVPLGFLGNKR